MRGRGRQLASRAMVRLVVGGFYEGLDCKKVVARKILLRGHVGADG
jgi:hypothetical protein